MDKPTKMVYQLESPFMTTLWPEVSVQDQNTIVELLIRFLRPIGQYRVSRGSVSKGKKEKKRKRTEQKAEESPPKEIVPTTPVPEILPYVTIGLNAIMRTLESSSQKRRPKVPSISDVEDIHSPSSEGSVIPLKDTASDSLSNPHFSAIFVSRSSQPNILHAHLPQLIATATLAYPEYPATRLVQLPKGYDEHVGEALGLPRASFIGLLEGAPHLETLVDLIRGCIAPVELPSPEKIWKGGYLPVKVSAIETKVGKSMKAQPT